MWADYLTDQKNFTGHIFNIKLEKKSYKMSFKAPPVKIQQSKKPQQVKTGADRVKTSRMAGAKSTYHKERSFVTNYFIFMKISFQFKSFL